MQDRQALLAIVDMVAASVHQLVAQSTESKILELIQ
jgi:hypothetical protein